MNVLFEGKTSTGKDEWLTPPHLIKCLGEFDLDPCSPIKRPWPTAKHHFTVEDDGLKQNWFGRVWCNPPYGDVARLFLNKCAAHGNAVGLVFSRLETEWFYESVWNKADAVYFIKGRLSFYHVEGTKGGTAGCGSVLVAYGENNIESIKNSGIAGKLIIL